MHAALHLIPILGAEKSKTPFYIVGGALVLWAFFLGLGIDRLRPGFPENIGGQRLLVAITALLVAGTLAAAVATSGTPSQARAPASGTSTSPSAAPSGPATSLPLAADPSGQIRYDTRNLSASAGAVTIDFTNASPLMHNVTIAQGTKVLGATPTFTGGSKRLALSLKPGRYVFYCSVPGHREAGMEGTLTVL
jgi:plastocyanin